MATTRILSAVTLLALLFPALASAETAYVTDKLQAGIRAQPGRDTPPIKTVSTGAALEVLERAANFARVRDADGVEGWIDAGVLSAEPPARSQLEGLKGQISGLKGQLEKAQATLAQETAKSADLAQKLADKTAQLEKTAVEPVAPAAEPATAAGHAADQRAAAEPTGQDGSWFSPGWLAFSFAMLIVGFLAGVVWLREVNRRKLGGMYLRI